MKSAQVGWTEILNNVIGFHVDQDPAPILLVQPTLEMAEAWSKDRLAPMIRDTPALRDRISDPRARDSGNTLLHKRFTGGHLTIAGANSPAGLASRPIRIALFDEVDRFPASAGAEGDPISLGRKRTTTFWNRKVLGGSTPTIKGESRIESAFEGSDQRHFWVPCTSCGTMQRLIWAQVRWPDGEPQSAVYACQHCSDELHDADKAKMIAAGEWRSAKPFNGIAGFHISELYSPWVTWGEMAASFLEAKRLPETLQTWINTCLGETWEDRGETVEAGDLFSRREPYTANSLPPGALIVTAGTDVQDDRLETTFWAWGVGEEAWRVEHVVLRGDPGQPDLWAEHDQILKKKLRTDDGRLLTVEAVCVDSGGHFTEQVYRYAAARKRNRVWAIKGFGGLGRLVWPKQPGRGAKVKVDVWLVGFDTVKDLLYGRLRKVTEAGPGFIHFDADTTEQFVDQLTSETVVWRQSQGRKVRMFKPKRTGTRQEALDCMVYAYAALIGRGGAELLTGRGKRQAEPQSAEPVEQQPERLPERALERLPERAIESTPEATRVVHRPRAKGSWMRNRWQ